MASPDSLVDLEDAIRALESQRALLGDRLVDTALAPLRAQLQASRQALAREKLRQVSVLFVDVVASTVLAGRLDPEDTHAVLDNALMRWTALVGAHGGHVMQYAGDGFLAGFGVHAACEDDAERAVRCGLAMQHETQRIAAEVLARHGVQGFDLRVGVHTGGVLLAGGVDADYSLRGAVVNIAARMQQTAPAGALRISQDTFHQVRGLFELVPQAPLTVRGLDAPVRTYLVQRALPRRFSPGTRGIDGLPTRMIGRAADLDCLKRAYTQLQTERRLALTTIVGDPGLGKSRLLNEFSHWFGAQAQRCVVLRGRAHPQTQSQPFGMLRDMLAWRLKIGDGRSMAQARRIFVYCVQPLFSADGPDIGEAHVHLLGHLIGLDFAASPHLRGILDDPRQIRQRAFHAAALALRRMVADDGCLLLLLDDLHWADDGSIELLKHVLHANRDVPALVLCLMRQTLFERRADCADLEGQRQRIELKPLDLPASTALAGELLRRLPQVPDSLRDLLVGRSEGNPYYMEELVRMLLDQGALRADGEHWAVDTQRLHGDVVPTTLTGVLQARLDGLPEAERQALQTASVLGAAFWDRALAALDGRAVALLPALAQRGLTLLRPEVGPHDARVYAFRQQFLHDVVYETLLKRERRVLHERAAHWLSEQTAQGGNMLLGAAAEHFEKAGDAARACACFADAADQARQRYAHEAALGYVARALALLDALPQGAAEVADGAGVAGATDAADATDTARLHMRWRLLDVRERALDLQGRRIEQRADLDALAAVATALGDDARRAELALRHSLLAGRGGDFARQEQCAREAIALAQAAADDARRLNAQRLLADARARQGDVASGEAMALEGLAEARARGWQDLESRFLNALAVIAARRQDMVAMLQASHQAAALRGALGDRRNQATGLVTEGIGWLELGALERASHCLEQGLALTRAVGDLAMEPIALANLSQLALWRDDVAQARALGQQAVDSAVAVQAGELEVLALCTLGNALLGQSAGQAAQVPQASEVFARALAKAQASGSALRFDALAGQARAALAADRPDDARTALAALLAHLDQGGSFDGAGGQALVELSCHQVLAATGDARAGSMLCTSHQALLARAAALSDPSLRQDFLQRVPVNRALVAAWAGRQAG